MISGKEHFRQYWQQSDRDGGGIVPEKPKPVYHLLTGETDIDRSGREIPIYVPTTDPYKTAFSFKLGREVDIEAEGFEPPKVYLYLEEDGVTIRMSNDQWERDESGLYKLEFMDTRWADRRIRWLSAIHTRRVDREVANNTIRYKRMQRTGRYR